MAFSDTATQQRQQEAKTLKQFLTYSLAGSLALHLAVLFSTAGFWKFTPEVSDAEIAIVVTGSEAEPEEPVEDEAELLADGGGGGGGGSSLLTEEAMNMLDAPPAPIPPPETPVEAPQPPPVVPEEESIAVESSPQPEAQPAPSADSVPTPAQPSTGSRRGLSDLLEDLRQGREARRGTGSGVGSGTGSGIGSGTGSGVGSGTGSGIGSGRGSGTGNGTGSGTGNGTGSGNSESATRQVEPSPPAPAQPGQATCRNCPQVEYPESALESGAEGKVRVVAETDEQGRVVGVTLIESSGNPDLDQAVLEQVQREYEFDGTAAGSAIPIEVDMTIEGSDYNREATERGERTEVGLPAAADAPSEAPETATEPIAPAPTSIDAVNPQVEPSTATPEADNLPVILDASPVPPEAASTPTPETNTAPAASDAPETPSAPIPDITEDLIPSELQTVPEPVPETETPPLEIPPEAPPEATDFEPEILPPPAEPESYIEPAPEPVPETTSPLQPEP